MKFPKRNGLVLFIILIAFPGIAQKFRPVDLSAKTIDKNLAKVTDSLYAYRYETSNGEYNLFLEAIKKSNHSSYTKFLTDSLNWPLQYSEPLRISYHRHPAYTRFPVVNISHEAANAYCKWLTGLYNNDPRREFKRVEFILPSANEWTRAAQGGRSQAMFPWGNYYLVNKKGFYMCNFKPVGDAYHVRDSLGDPIIINYTGNPEIHSAEFPPEKTFYLMNIESFTPNDFGMYNASGNAAEMIVEQGYAMGGSWNSYGGEVFTKSIKQYKYPSPEVGFRVFMKIIER